ncbi:hypothetical protein PCC7418_1213 [Halothece sp. PCC 7418]|uniref:hypothetical protein n=1 Tax=Halothece sp. (strain PCC 7418) TaxID=65093 RepID=UPI0002A06996|nr:hypothetical protein [Halothece sp. PCC 7418]AFZ43415.1 hypothetical protein PCC7418_1213 [Halothece sp. PCC 7418]
MLNRFFVLGSLIGATTLFAPVTTANVAAETLIAQRDNRYIVATSAQNGTLYLNTDKRYSYNLEVTRGGRFAGLNLPAGSIIRGQYVPDEGGLRYVANSVVVNGRTYNLNGSSGVLNPVKDPRDTSGAAVGEDAAIGAGAGLVLSEIFGDADLGAAVGGAAAGAATGNVTADRVVVVEPDQPITLYN